MRWADLFSTPNLVLGGYPPSEVQEWQVVDRALDARSRAHFRHQANDVKKQPGIQLVALYMGPHKPPTHYVRVKLSIRAVLAGRKATLPWRKVA